MVQKHTHKNELPPIPKPFGLPFYYATLFNIEVAFLVDYEKVEKYLKGTGLIAAKFKDEAKKEKSKDKAIVSFNFQNYTGQFPNGASTTQEIELNIVSYPESQKETVAFVSAKEYLRGEEQTKLMGHKRVWVPCDADMAIEAGKKLFGEPKFKTTFDINLPSLNAPGQNTWMVTCNGPVDPKKPDSKPTVIFTCKADVANLIPEMSAFSPITEYGKYGEELIGCRWNILQPTSLYFLSSNEAKRVQMTYGDSTHEMKKDMEQLIGDTPAFAVRTSMSAPAAIQTRAYYI